MFVRDEVTQAIAASRGFVPVLLCPFPITSTISDYQWVDCREIVVHACEKHGDASGSNSASYDVRSFLEGADVTADELDEIARSWGPASKPPPHRRMGWFLWAPIIIAAILNFTVGAGRDYSSLLIYSNWIIVAVVVVALLVVFLRPLPHPTSMRPGVEGVSFLRPEQMLALIVEVAVRDATHEKALMR
jgi:hypothetical protein